MVAPSTSLGVFFFFVGLISISSATTSKWLILGEGQSQSTNAGRYMLFEGSTTGTMGHVFNDQSIPQSTAVIDQAVVVTSYTLISFVEALFFLELTFSNAGLWTSVNIFTLNGGPTTFATTTTSATFSFLSSTFTFTAAPATLCSAFGTTGGSFTLTDTSNLITHAGMGIDEFLAGDATVPSTTSYVTSYSSNTFTVKAKGFSSTSTDPKFLNFFLNSAGTRYWGRVQVSTATWTFLADVELFDFASYTTFSTTGSGTSTLQITDTGGSWENTKYTFSISSNPGNC